jgi:hypothetical protein
MISQTGKVVRLPIAATTAAATTAAPLSATTTATAAATATRLLPWLSLVDAKIAAPGFLPIQGLDRS